MPELPEVETTRRGIEPALVGRRITGWQLRQPRLRWPVVLPDRLRGARVLRVLRRAKYLILETSGGCADHPSRDVGQPADDADSARRRDPTIMSTSNSTANGCCG